MISRLILATVFALTLSTSAFAADINVLIKTNKGDITVALNADKAPVTVVNFLRYVDEGFYTNTIFHRVIKGFMVQGGGFDNSMNRKETLNPIQNEADNGLLNYRGTIAMARTSDPHSATAQFFINHADNTFLDFTAKSQRGWGYAVFGKVTKGLNVVDDIARTSTGSGDKPRSTILIESITRI